MRAAGAGDRSWWRWAAVAVLALLALHAMRVAVVAGYAGRDPAVARAVWPSHPAPIFASALAGIGAAARKGQSPAPELLALVERGGRHAPLAAEPLLVAGTAALEVGDHARAERLLLGAMRRDPRAPATRFLLADLYVRQQRIGEAMAQIVALDRRIGNVASGFAPAIASFLEQPGAPAKLLPVLADSPALRQAVLAHLAAGNGRIGLLVALAGRGDAHQPWLASALARLLAAGEMTRARALHARTVGTDRLPGLTRWSPGEPASPITWRFPAGSGGAVEPIADGPLRIAYFGREETVLAQHWLTLAPGRHRLSQRLSPGSVPGGTFEWRLTCAGARQSASTLSFAAGEGTGVLAVPACPAQLLSLVGRPGDFPRTVNAELSAVTLEPAGSAQ